MTKKELIEALEPYDDDVEIFGIVDAAEVHNSGYVYDDLSISRGTVQTDMLDPKPSLYIVLKD